jgi:DNA mismatch repair protein MutS2
MQPAVLRTLEFDRIRDALAREASTPLGRARVLALAPAVDGPEVQRRLDRTSEAAEFMREGGSLALAAADDLPRVLDILEIDDQPLDPLQLVGLARFVESVAAVAAGIVRAGEAGPLRGRPARVRGRLLGEIAGRAASFVDETAAIHRAIEPSGDVSDHASPALRDIRERLRRQRTKLRSTLEAFTRGRDTAKYLQDQIVTDRNGRYVLVVRAEHGGAIPGIVHGTSASGASVYLEPLSTVELNNEIVGLAEREVEEVRRILLALTNAFRLRGAEFAATLDVAADLDELHAKAELARRVDGVAPTLATDGCIELRGARHPLLIPAVRDLLVDEQAPSPSNPVPVDLLVVPPTHALVISGPNTGGKTVALKAVGLLTLMAQSGLLIPVDTGSRLTPFRSIFADIGDEQSISASLSTFSAHVAHIVAMDRALDLPALVLLDEVGGGTDPIEGGALGTAVIGHFCQRGATVVATTHDDGLKSYAATTDGVVTAAFGFNPETYAPTYRLVYGAPGRSLALEIAERLGMPATVIADARARRSARESQLAAHLARVDQELAALERDRRLAETDRTAVARRASELDAQEAQLREREALLKRRVDDKLNDRLREAREEIDRVVTELKGKAESLAEQAERRALSGRPMLTTGEIGGVKAQARAALATIGRQLELPTAADGNAGRFDRSPVVGETVLVATFGAEGIVRGVSGKDIDVEIRGKRLRVSLEDLRRPTVASPDARPPRAHGAVNVGAAPRLAGAARELVVIGATVDQALARAEKFLDDALLTDERRLRVVHGHGTGRLREALRAYFREHALVASVAPAPDTEGGEGATIVELKE